MRVFFGVNCGCDIVCGVFFGGLVVVERKNEVKKRE